MADVERFVWNGMNRILNPFDIKPGDLKVCLNYNSDTFFAKKRRSGYSLFLNNPDNEPVYALIPFDRADGERFVYRVSGNYLYSYNYSGNTWGSALSATTGGVNDQVQTIGTTHDTDAKLDATTDKVAQGFTLSGSGSKTVPSIWILLKQTGTTAGNITVKIETDNAGSPSGTAVTYGTHTIGASEVPTTGETWMRVDFISGGNSPSLTAGTLYHITIAAAATLDGSNYYEWYGASFDAYSGGSAQHSTNSGTSYSAISVEPDLGFVVNVRTGNRIDWEIINNQVIIADGISGLKYLGGGGGTALSEPPVKYLQVWKGRLYGIGSVLARSRLYYSKVGIESGDADNWTNDPLDASTGGYVDIDADHYGSGVGLDVVNDRLIVHKQGQQYKIIPDEFGRPAQIVPIGEPTTSNWSIGESTELNSSFFFGENGVYQQTADTPTLISTPIQDLIDGVSGSVKTDLAGHYHRFKYYCSLGTTITEAENLGGRTYTNAVFVYDARLQEIYLYTTAHPIEILNSWKDANGVDNMYMGDTAGNTFKWDSSTMDYQTAIDGEFETWEDNFGAPHLTKRYEYISIETNPGCEASAYYKLDLGNPLPISDLTSGATKVYFGDSGFNKKNFTLKVTDFSTTTPSVFYGYVIRLSGEEIPTPRRGGK